MGEGRASVGEKWLAGSGWPVGPILDSRPGVVTARGLGAVASVLLRAASPLLGVPFGGVYRSCHPKAG